LLVLQILQIRITLATVENNFSVLDYTEATYCWMWTVGSWGPWFWHWGKQWSCRRFIDFVLLVIMPNYWPI